MVVCFVPSHYRGRGKKSPAFPYGPSRGYHYSPREPQVKIEDHSTRLGPISRIEVEDEWHSKKTNLERNPTGKRLRNARYRNLPGVLSKWARIKKFSLLPAPTFYMCQYFPQQEAKISNVKCVSRGSFHQLAIRFFMESMFILSIYESLSFSNLFSNILTKSMFQTILGCS